MSAPVAPDDPRPEGTIGARDLTRWRTRAGQLIDRGFSALLTLMRPETGAAVFWLVAAAIVVGASIGMGEIYEDVSQNQGLAVVDGGVLAWVLSIRTPTANAVIAVFSESGGPVWMTVITAIAVTILCLIWRRWTPLVLMVIGVAGSLAMTTVGKRLYGRARPDLADSIPPPETSASFPSGHSLNSFVIAGLLCYLLLSHIDSAIGRTAAVAVTVLYVVAMGLSRVYLGHHWLTDVLAAWCLGAVWLTVVITGHRLYLTHHRKHDVARAEQTN